MRAKPASQAAGGDHRTLGSGLCCDCALTRTHSHSFTLANQVSPRDVCIQFGCLKLEKIVRDTLEEYDVRRGGDRASVVGTTEDQRMGNTRRGDLGTEMTGRDGRWSPRLVGAAFTLVAEAYNTRIDKKRLIAALGIQQREYKAALEAMGNAMHDVFFEDKSDGDKSDGGDAGGDGGDT